MTPAFKALPGDDGFAGHLALADPRNNALQRFAGHPGHMG